MKNLKEISEERTLALEADGQQALDDLKKPLTEGAEFTRKELSVIQAAFAEAHVYRKENIDSINWEAIGGMPRPIANAVFELDQLGSNIGALTEMLRRYDGLTVEDAWGNRPDGSRDVNKAATIRGSFNFLLAHGCAGAIDEQVRRLKAEIARIEERLAWTGESLSAEARRINVPSPAGSDRVEVVHNLDHD